MNITPPIILPAYMSMRLDELRAAALATNHHDAAAIVDQLDLFVKCAKCPPCARNKAEATLRVWLSKHGTASPHNELTPQHTLKG